jgi:hypothetical protein
MPKKKKSIIITTLAFLGISLCSQSLPQQVSFDGVDYKFRERAEAPNGKIFIYTDEPARPGNWVSRFSILIHNEQIAPGTWINSMKRDILQKGGILTGEKIPQKAPEPGMLAFIYGKEASIWKVTNLENGQLIAYEITLVWPSRAHAEEWIKTHQQKIASKILATEFPKLKP